MTIFNGSTGDDIFTGGAGNDEATGNRGNDRLSGGAGNDVLIGNAGADRLSGGDDSDWLFSADGNRDDLGIYEGRPTFLDQGATVDVLMGGDGSDRLFAGYGDSVDGGEDGDYGDYLYISFLGANRGVTVDFSLETQTIGGGTITGIENVSYVEGSNFGDTIDMASRGYGYTDFDRCYGMGGNDKLTAGYYTWILDGGDGDDIVDGRPSQYLNYVYGGAGNDIVYAATNTFAAADGGDGNDTIYAGGETHGGAGNDKIYMQYSYYGGLVTGDAGNDTIIGADSGSSIAGGTGADALTGGVVGDHLYSADFVWQDWSDQWNQTGQFIDEPVDDMGLEKDVIAGGGGDDQIAIGYGDSADGGLDSDTLRLSLGGLKTGIVFDTKGIVSGKAFSLGGGTIKNIEALLYLRGTEFNDTLTLATQDTLLEVNAGAGDDTIISNASSVAVMGGKGADRFISGVAGDTFDGGEGVDTIDYSRSTTAVTVNLATGVGARGDTVTNVENITGSNLNDALTGNAAANLLDGGKGADKMNGGGGNDVYVVDDLKDVVTEGKNAGVDTVNAAVSWTLGANLENLTLTGSAGATGVGNAGANTLVGNGAANVLRGLAGADVLTGGAGSDVFDFDSLADSTVAAFDRITDLTDSDRIDLSGIDANTKTKGDQAFAIVDAFTHKAGQMTLTYSAATKLTTILMDVDGDGKADMKIVLNGDHHDYDNFFF